ncbi:MAG: AAA family ATPase [Acidobacteriota bacterium]|nr:AAA family ATPase [Acidobacteriota bacterium]MDD8038818.1 AAA family ATPase [Acidobacteriota bacterium]MDW3226924.1 AAA family ATPase [Acidobacteriota bacterium]HOS10637.1 AAA family ATPase [Candidatus Aminicenantes bacterium]HPL12770.1 AAA family ATPase [Candidatus Aminicenantes bacterium]
MLEKIVEIKNVGRFRGYSAKGDVTLRKLTLVYADNGSGKTTLCAILRSLQTGQSEFITERKTLASTAAASVHFRLDNANYQFTNDAWTVTHPDILIFDSVFVNDNVYSGDYVEHEHRKNLYRVIVGAQGVQLAKEIEQLDGQVRDANTDLRTKKEAVTRHVPSGVPFDDYLQWQPLADVEAQIRQKTEELNNRQRAAAKSGEIQAKGLFVKVQIPSPPSDFAAVLAKQLTDIVADAETKVRQQIARHQMGHQGEPWLSQGLGYVRDNRCPFCGQGVQVNELIEAYRSHFSAAYENLKQEVAHLGQRVNGAIGETSLGSAQQTIAGNTALAEFWRQFTTVDLPVISFPDIQQKYAALRDKCLALAKKKQDNPTEAITPDAEFAAVLAKVDALRTAVATYNAAADAANLRVNEQKTAARSQADITTLKNELVQLDARKKRFEPEVAGACQAYQDAVAAKTRLEQSKNTARQQLDQHCQNLLGTYEQSINEYLDQFNAGFRITNTRHLYTGGTPSSQYQIEINNSALDLGDARTPAGTPCFKTALSSGDRSAMALAFFLSVLKQDADIGRKIVVFDDPFTSLDRFRRTCTQQLIQRLLDSAQQVIVLSHDPLFLKLLSDECPSSAANVKTLQMSKAGDTTIIGEWDVQAEAQSSYMKDFSTLLGFYRERKGDPRAVARTIRPFLEGMMRSHFPGQFQQNEWLGDFIGKIRAASATDGLQHAKADLAELDAINGYSKKYHHQQNANADTEPINDDELHGFVKRTLRLVGGS